MRNEEWRVALRTKIKAKQRADIQRVVMPSLDPSLRVSQDAEVNLGLTPELAVTEASRCLDCVNPTCMEGCPVGIEIPTFIKLIEAGEFIKAAQTIKRNNLFPYADILALCPY